MEIDRLSTNLMTGLTGYVRRYEFNKNMRIWETCTILAEKEFMKLEDQADFNKRVDPLKYVGKLLLSVFTALIGLLFVVVILMIFLENTGLGAEGVNPIQQMGTEIHESDNSTTSLVLTIVMSHIFISLSFFFIIATAHGNTTVGQRFATFTFYAMRENETLLNSFLANSAFNNVVCTGVKQYAIYMFDDWTRGSIAYEEATITRNTRIFF